MTLHRKGPDTETLKVEYLTGATTVDLAKKYAMSPPAINSRLRRGGVVLRPAWRRCVGDTQLPEIVSAYQNGMSVVDIASQFGSSRSSIARFIRRSGVAMHPHGLRTRTVKIPTSQIALGYLCGLFDGEGNLQIRHKHGGSSVACKMAIYSTTPKVMQWLIANVGGSARVDTKRTMKKGWLPIGIWSLYRAQDVAALLKAMLPYLIIKREKAEHALSIFGSKFRIHDSPPQITQ